MIELLVGLLSSLLPVFFQMISDKLDSDKPKPRRKVEDDVTALIEAKEDEEIAAVFESHDHRMRSLLREARAKRSRDSD